MRSLSFFFATVLFLSFTSIFGQSDWASAEMIDILYDEAGLKQAYWEESTSYSLSNDASVSELVGQTFFCDYGHYTFEVTLLSQHTIYWKDLGNFQDSGVAMANIKYDGHTLTVTNFQPQQQVIAWQYNLDLGTSAMCVLMPSGSLSQLDGTVFYIANEE